MLLIQTCVPWRVTRCLKMKKTRSDDRDQRAKYGTASVSSFNHGWRNYRFIFSIIFIFTICPFALHSPTSPSLRCISLLFSSSSSLLLPVPSHSLHRVPRATSLIFSSPFLTLIFFSGSSWSRFTSFSALSVFLFLFDAVSSPLLPPSVSPSSSPLHSASPGILLPRTPCLIVVLFFCYHTRAIREYEGRRAPVWTQRSAS